MSYVSQSHGCFNTDSHVLIEAGARDIEMLFMHFVQADEEAFLASLTPSKPISFGPPPFFSFFSQFPKIRREIIIQSSPSHNRGMA